MGTSFKFDHHRDAPHLPVGVSVLDLLLEVNGAEHFEQLIRALRGAGLSAQAGASAALSTSRSPPRHKV